MQMAIQMKINCKGPPGWKCKIIQRWVFGTKRRTPESKRKQSIELKLKDEAKRRKILRHTTTTDERHQRTVFSICKMMLCQRRCSETLTQNDNWRAKKSGCVGSFRRTQADEKGNPGVIEKQRKLILFAINYFNLFAGNRCDHCFLHHDQSKLHYDPGNRITLITKYGSKQNKKKTIDMEIKFRK